MRFSAALLIVAAGIVSAATTTTSAAASTTSTACDAQNVVDACLGSTTAILQNCQVNDYICMCAAQESILTCYNNCPGDPLRSTAEGTKQSYCQAAAQQSAASIAVSGTPTIVSSSVKATTSAAVTGTAASASNASAKATSTGGAANVYAPAGGLAAIAMGVVGLL